MAKTLLEYYQSNDINPVPIDVSSADGWEAQVAKRVNLYRHLGVHVPLLAGQSVLEFGCNSGENSLVLASHDAKVNLVEPNHKVLPRLRELYAKAGLAGSIESLTVSGLMDFTSDRAFPLVLAEGFVNVLEDRDAALGHVCSFLQPGGMGVISFDDRYGYFIEMVRIAVFRRLLLLSGIADVLSQEALKAAQALFLEDYGKIPASRPFSAWFEDSLANVFVSWKYLWSFPEIIPILEQSGCEVVSTSPRWIEADRHTWYKKLAGTADWHGSVLDDWRRDFGFFVTGRSGALGGEMGQALVEDYARLIEATSDFAFFMTEESVAPELPQSVREGFAASADQQMVQLGRELEAIYAALKQMRDGQELCRLYLSSAMLRQTWGSAYHYVSFTRKAG
jgi:SAM-dependent methyltransferase